MGEETKAIRTAPVAVTLGEIVAATGLKHQTVLAIARERGIPFEEKGPGRATLFAPADAAALIHHIEAAHKPYMMRMPRGNNAASVAVA